MSWKGEAGEGGAHGGRSSVLTWRNPEFPRSHTDRFVSVWEILDWRPILNTGSTILWIERSLQGMKGKMWAEHQRLRLSASWVQMQCAQLCRLWLPWAPSWWTVSLNCEPRQTSLSLGCSPKWEENVSPSFLCIIIAGSRAPTSILGFSRRPRAAWVCHTLARLPWVTSEQ